MEREVVKISALKAAPYNPRQISGEALAGLSKSLERWGVVQEVVANKRTGYIVGGHQRVAALKKMGVREVPVVWVDLDDVEEKALNVALNNPHISGEFDDTITGLLTEIRDGIGPDDFESLMLDDLLPPDAENDETEDDKSETEQAGSLTDKFGAPPFSVLNAREGWWQERKRAWLAVGLKSELGRDEGLLKYSDRANDPSYYTKKKQAEKIAGKKLTDEEFKKDWYACPSDSYSSGTSIFDPVLCELAYSWFCPKDGVVLDPFAGGSVRGVVASKLGRQYVGVELREEQVLANRVQADDICDDPVPVWHVGDSRNIDRLCAGVDADFLFSCPPYADLEVYSDNPDDLSTLKYPEFREAYFDIIKKSCSRLRDNRFACFVVGDVRDKKGNYYNFVGDTVEAFRAAGLNYYNEAILVTAIGSLAIRVGRQFSAGRKLGKTHQNVLVFVKGSGKKATEACGPVEVNIQSEEANDATG